MRWVRGRCAVHFVPDVYEDGVVLIFTASAYTEPFLFNFSYGLVSNGSRLSGLAQLRRHLVQLAGHARLPLTVSSKRTPAVLRGAIILYLELVVDRLPDAVLRDSACKQADSSYIVIRFDGLYMVI